MDINIFQFIACCIAFFTLGMSLTNLIHINSFRKQNSYIEEQNRYMKYLIVGENAEMENVGREIKAVYIGHQKIWDREKDLIKQEIGKG